MKYYYLVLLVISVSVFNNWGLADEPVSISVNKETEAPEKPGVLESNGIVARVNDEIITQWDLDKMIRLLETPDRDLVLKIMIDERLLYQAAVDIGIEVTDDELEKALNKHVVRYGSSERFEEAVLKPLKLTFAEYREDIKRQLLREKFILEKMRSISLDKSQRPDFFIDTFVAPKEIKKYYDKHRNEFVEQEQIKTRQIILKIRNKSEKISKKALAEAILAELKKEADFDALARRYSEIKAETGGAWDWIPKGSFPKEVEDIIYQLDEGEISQIIETRTNFRIVKVEGKKGGTSSNFNNSVIQERIKRFLMNQKVVKGAEKLVQGLARNARIWPLNILVDSKMNK